MERARPHSSSAFVVLMRAAIRSFQNITRPRVLLFAEARGHLTHTECVAETGSRRETMPRVCDVMNKKTLRGIKDLGAETSLHITICGGRDLCGT